MFRRLTAEEPDSESMDFAGQDGWGHVYSADDPRSLEAAISIVTAV
jgi:hypothetical protein